MDLASLGFKIDTSDIQRANANLDDLNKQGSKSTATADAISKAWKDASTKMVGNTDAILVELKSLNTTQSQTAILMQKLFATVGQTTQGMKAQASAIDVSTQSIKLSGAATTEYVDRIREMVKQSTLAGSAAEAIVESQRSVAERAREAASAIDQESKATSNWAKEQADANARGKAFNDAEDRRVKAAKASASATGLESAELEKLMARVYPLQARLKALEDDEERLTKAFKAGQLSAAQYADGIAEIGKRKDVLDDLNTKANTAAGGFHKFELASAGARRELGVMLGEVAQGNFGNLEGSLATLANRTGLFSAALSPVGVLVSGAAAAIGILGVAAFQGSEQEEKLNASLISTGNYAGKSVGQLESLSGRIAMVSGSFGDARDIVDSLAASGKVTGAQFDVVAQGISDFAQVTGKSLSDAQQAFIDLGKDPVKSVQSLNEQYHFLTSSVYEQIESLQKQGSEEGAAAVAQKALADRFSERRAQVVGDLSWFQKSWKSVRDEASSAWDAMLGIGRQQSVDSQLASVTKQLEDIQKDHTITSNTPYGGQITTQVKGLSASDPEVQRLQNERLFLEAQKQGIDYANQAAALDQKRLQDGISAQDQLDKWGKGLDPVKEKLEAVKKVNDDITKQYKAFGTLPDGVKRAQDGTYSGKGYDYLVTAAQKEIGGASKSSAGLDNALLSADIQKYKDMLTAASGAFSSYQKNLDTQYKAGLITADDYYSKMRESVSTSADTQVAEINAEISVLQKFHGTQQQNVEAQKQIGTLQAQAADIQAKASSKIKDLNTEETAEVDKKKAAYDALTASLSQQLAVEDQRIQTQIDSVSMGSKEISQQSALTEIDQRRADQLQRYRDQLDKNQIDKSSYDADVAKVNSIFARMRDDQIDGYAQIDKAQSSWTKGASKGWLEFRDQAIDVSDEVASAVGDAFSTFTDDMVTALNTGKLSFKSFATSVIEDVERIFVKLAEEQAVSSILSYFIPSTGVSLSGADSYTGQGVASDIAGFKFASGGVVYGGNISDYSGSVVSSPTLFSGSHITAFANGGNVMGEAGPEAILPLRRGSDGKLGVQMAGGSSQAVTVNVVTNVDQSGNASTSVSSTDQSTAWKQVSQNVAAAAKQEISKALQPGGQIYNKLNGR